MSKNQTTIFKFGKSLKPKNLILIFDYINPFPNSIMFASSKVKEFADDKSKFDEYGTKFSKWVENNVVKEKIAHSETCTLDI